MVIELLAVEDYTAILKKRWWIIAIPALILPIAGYAASYLVDPQYVSQDVGSCGAAEGSGQVRSACHR